MITVRMYDYANKAIIEPQVDSLEVISQYNELHERVPLYHTTVTSGGTTTEGFYETEKFVLLGVE